MVVWSGDLPSLLIITFDVGVIFEFLGVGVKILYHNILTRSWCLSRLSRYNDTKHVKHVKHIKHVKVFYLSC